MSKNQKRYLVSSIITFVSAFLIALVANIDQLTLASLSWSVVGGLLLVCVRAGIKALAEFFVAKFSKKVQV